jgi:glyoxylase-like metal-dependent hydrolase (beta-lactamase superfamily II)
MSGTGWNGAVGQSYSPNDDWPRFEVTSYTRMIDYGARSSKEDLTRRQGNYPPRGGGGTPIQGDQRQELFVSGNYAWNLAGTNVNPQPAAAEVRQLDIWLTPHGFIKAAMAATDATAASFVVAGPSVPGVTQNGGRMTIVSFTALGKYKVQGTINTENLVEFVQTWVPNPVLGDMLYEVRYTDYKDFGGAKFPTFIHAHQGNPRLNPGHNSLELRFTSVQPNAAVAAITVPEAVQKATLAPVRAEGQKLADGTWLIAGGSHNSVAVEFRDFVTVIEAPLNEERSVAVMREVQRLIPNKPIKYVVNTHHHFDHSGGLRTYVAEGATVITHQGNREFYEDVLLYPAPRNVEPDRMSRYYPLWNNNRTTTYETVGQKYVVSDGVRTLELHPVQGLNHNSTMLIAYFPKEQILVNADMYNPPAPGAKPLTAATPNMRTLAQNIQRLKLNVAQHVGIHGAAGPAEDFMKLVSQPSN